MSQISQKNICVGVSAFLCNFTTASATFAEVNFSEVIRSYVKTV